LFSNVYQVVPFLTLGDKSIIHNPGGRSRRRSSAFFVRLDDGFETCLYQIEPTWSVQSIVAKQREPETREVSTEGDRTTLPLPEIPLEQQFQLPNMDQARFNEPQPCGDSAFDPQMMDGETGRTDQTQSDHLHPLYDRSNNRWDFGGV
jgi:hypothetical protein